MYKVPPYPLKKKSGDQIIIDQAEIKLEMEVYQKHGLMDHGSVWGHGALRGVDFSADTLHRIGVYMREYYAGELGGGFSDLSVDEKSKIDVRVINEIKFNSYDSKSGTLS